MNVRQFMRLAHSSAVPDTTPDAFSFTDVTDAAFSSVIVSNAIVVAGIDSTAPISITGGEYQLDGGAWTTAAGIVAVGQSVTVRHTSSANPSTSTNTVLAIGSASDTFTSTTAANDAVPDAFAFTPQTGATRATAYDSNTVTISGINLPSPVTVAGGTVSINGGSQVASGTITNGQTLKAQITSSASYSTLVSASVTVGGVTASFDVTTEADPTPTPTPSETIAAPKVGTADYTATSLNGTGASTLATLMTRAYNDMQAAADPNNFPLKIAVNISGDVGADWFPTGRTYPSQLSIVPADYANPPRLRRVGLSSLGNLVIDGLDLTYSPAADTFPPALAATNCVNLTVSNMAINLNDGSGRNPSGAGRGIAITLTGGTDVTFYRVGIPSGGGSDNNKMVLVQHASSSSTPCVRPRFIECALQNGKGGDGFRILGVQDAYFARNLIENLTRNSVNDHCDAMQITQDGFNVANSLTCVDPLHWGNDATHHFEGFQITNANVQNGAIVLRRATIIGSEVNGTFILGCESPVLEDNKIYHFDYGDGSQLPKLVLKKSFNCTVTGANKAAGGLNVDNSLGTITYTPGGNGTVATTAMNLGTDTAARDVIVNAWKTGVGASVPFV